LIPSDVANSARSTSPIGIVADCAGAVGVVVAVVVVVVVEVVTAAEPVVDGGGLVEQAADEHRAASADARRTLKVAVNFMVLFPLPCFGLE
jgi:hypothetical protein